MVGIIKDIIILLPVACLWLKHFSWNAIMVVMMDSSNLNSNMNFALN